MRSNVIMPGQAPKKNTYTSTIICVLSYLFSTLGLGILVMGYIVMGAFMFQALESRKEELTRSNVRQQREEHVERLSNLSKFQEDWQAVVEESFLTFQEQIYLAVKVDGWDGHLEGSYEDKWSFPGAFLYCVTVVTTIGYGNTVPNTDRGKVATIVYGFLGIPLTLLLLANVGSVMGDCIRAIVRCCTCRCKRKKKPANPTNLPTSSRMRNPVSFLSASPNSRRPNQSIMRAASPDFRASSRMPKHSSMRAASPDFRATSRMPKHTSPRAASSESPMSSSNDMEEKGIEKIQTQTEATLYRQEETQANLAHGAKVKKSENAEGITSKAANIDSDRRRARSRNFENNPSKRALQTVTVPIKVTLIIISLYLLLGAAMFSVWQKNWTFLDACYFCFITLSTIGFGDYVFGSGGLYEDHGKLIACAAYLVFGLSIIAMAFDLLKEVVATRLKRIFRKIAGE